MATGTVTIGVTPCCGVIERTYECWSDEASPTRMIHRWEYEGGKAPDLTWSFYAPDFAATARLLDRGICPDCGKPGPVPGRGSSQGGVTQTLLATADQQSCGCPACDNGIQPGHFTCSQSPAVLLQLEREGYLARYYDGTRWVWERTKKQSAAEQMQAGRSVSLAPAPRAAIVARKAMDSSREVLFEAATLADLQRARSAASLYGECVIDETRLAGYVKVRRNWDAQEVAQSLNNL